MDHPAVGRCDLPGCRPYGLLTPNTRPGPPPGALRAGAAEAVARAASRARARHRVRARCPGRRRCLGGGGGERGHRPAGLAEAERGVVRLAGLAIVDRDEAEEREAERRERLPARDAPGWRCSAALAGRARRGRAATGHAPDAQQGRGHRGPGWNTASSRDTGMTGRQNGNAGGTASTPVHLRHCRGTRQPERGRAPASGDRRPAPHRG